MIVSRIAGVVALTVVACAAAGPTLAPPAGPVAESGRFGTRCMIPALPYTITDPGSYYLADNLTGVAGQHGITIDADDVTIDLNGFALVGVPGSLEGVTIANTHINIGIRNGTVRDWGRHGIYLFNGTNAIIEGIRASGNGQSGIAALHAILIKGCVASSNGNDGIVGGTMVVVDCLAYSNNADGIELGVGGVVSNCVAKNNGSRGIASNVRSMISGCSASNNRDGILVFPDCTVIECTVTDNTFNGIAVQDNCTVSRCSSTINGTSGIAVSGDGSRIDDNNVVGNLRGVYVITPGNLIIRNSASDNGPNDYDIVAGNDVGPIGTAATSTSPWANISF